MLTNEEIEAIRKRAEEATEGEWRFVPVDGGPELVIVGESGNEYVGEVLEKTVAEFIAAAREDIPKLLADIERLREKHVKKEITKIIPGGGKCPSCEVRLIGKANYCGKCGQRVGWEVYGGNIYDNNGGDE